jgi:DNA topoisomerase-3
MKVCIAEKPSVAGEIAKVIGANSRRDGYYEGNGYAVTWTFGHLCTLNEPSDYKLNYKKWELFDLPILPEKFGVKVMEDKGVQKQFNTIKSLVAKASEVINCGDAGQEGELIQRWVLEQAECKAPIKRLWISSLTEEAIKEGFQKLMDGKDFDPLYAAGKCRAIGDWLYGINATRLFTLKYAKPKQVWSVGRVQTPTLAMIVRRHFEIKNFVPKHYFEIKTMYRETTFSSAKGKIEDKAKAEEYVEMLKEHPFTIEKVEIKQGKEHPPALFDLTSLQVEANKKYGFSAEQTLKITQNLYEKKYVSYPRVDTVYLPKDQYKKIPGILKGIGYSELVQPILAKPIRKSKKVFNDNKVTDHHAIIPTGVVPNAMNADESKVFDLIAKKFIAAFYPECTVSNTTVMAKVQQIGFKATGKQILEPGWRVVYTTDSNSGNKEIMPNFEKGESGPHEPILDKKQTSPPKEFTEATLLRAMETAGKQVDDEELKQLMKENGIGRPSTRANIIETLFKRTYIEKKKKKILPTEKGIALIQTIENPVLKSAALTGAWEKKLRDIENETYNAEHFIDEMKALVDDLVKGVVSSNGNDANKIRCPKCEVGWIVKGNSSYGCSEWKNGCDLVIPFNKKSLEISAPVLASLVQKRELQITHEQQKVHLILDGQFDTLAVPEKSLKCPKCQKGKIKKGSSAWGCSEYSKTCDFILPFELFPEPPNAFQVYYLTHKKNLQMGNFNYELSEDGGIEKSNLKD